MLRYRCAVLFWGSSLEELYISPEKKNFERNNSAIRLANLVAQVYTTLIMQNNDGIPTILR